MLSFSPPRLRPSPLPGSPSPLCLDPALSSFSRFVPLLLPLFFPILYLLGSFLCLSLLSSVPTLPSSCLPNLSFRPVFSLIQGPFSLSLPNSRVMWVRFLFQTKLLQRCFYSQLSLPPHLPLLSPIEATEKISEVMEWI